MESVCRRQWRAIFDEVASRKLIMYVYSCIPTYIYINDSANIVGTILSSSTCLCVVTQTCLWLLTQFMPIHT